MRALHAPQQGPQRSPTANSGHSPMCLACAAAGQLAEVEPGDAVFIPAMWWHHVEGLSAFNTLVNYWWSSTPEFTAAIFGSFQVVIF